MKKLFEIHVISCARGNFIEGGLTFKERLKNPNEETEVTCECKGLIIDGTYSIIYFNIEIFCVFFRNLSRFA